jgi:GT2 family glycosyltransferase
MTEYPKERTQSSQRVLFHPREQPDHGPDVAGDLAQYRTWLEGDEKLRTHASVRESLSFAVFFYSSKATSDSSAIELSLRSLSAQTLQPTSVICINCVGSKKRFSRFGRHVQFVQSEEGDANAHLSLALANTPADACVILAPGDVLVPDALSLLASGLKGADAAYGDEDSYGDDGNLENPILKPDYSPQFALQSGYVGRPVAFRSQAIRDVGGFQPLSHGGGERDLLLRIGEQGQVNHVPHVLCHRGKTGKDMEEHEEIFRRFFARTHFDGEVSRNRFTKRKRIVFHPPTNSFVSIIIPFRNSTRFLRSVVESVTQTTKEIKTEFVLVDNGSTDPETASLIELLGKRDDVTIVNDPQPFNWASLNNDAAKVANGNYLLFLNDDIEALHEGWLSLLLGQLQDPRVGAVGARLLYPNQRLQHCGVVVGMGGAAGHLLSGLPSTQPGYLTMAVTPREVSAVTGACLLTPRALFEKFDGFDVSLGIDLNDIDYCLRLSDEGYRIIYEPGSELIHYESPTRGTSASAANIISFMKRWEALLTAGDRFLHPAITRAQVTAGLGSAQEKLRWQQWRTDVEAMQ